jgi:hypothetical protein
MLMQRNWVGGVLFSLIFTLLLAGCGSGGGGDTTTAIAPSATAEPVRAPWGLWTGTSSDGRTVRGAVTDNNYWFWYSAIGDPTVLRGGVQGHFDLQTEGVLASSDLIDFSMDKVRPVDGTLTGTYVKQHTINGTITTTDGESVSFSLTYQPNSGSAPDNLGNPDPTVLADMAQIVGTYEGLTATITISPGADFSIQGYFDGFGGTRWETAPCPTTSGAIYPQYWGAKAYQFSVKDDCQFPIRWLNGVGVFDAATNKLFLFAVRDNRLTAFIHDITKR